MHFLNTVLICVLVAETVRTVRQDEDDYESSSLSASQEVTETCKSCLLQTKHKLHRTGAFAEDDSAISVVPEPLKWERTGDGLLVLQSPLAVKASEKSRKAFKDQFLSATEGTEGSSLIDMRDEEESGAAVVELLLDAGSFGEEGYSLQVDQEKVFLQAGTEHGIFNGLMTLRQLLNKTEAGKWTLPAVKIEDKPAFAWRGLMLDVSRHFFPPEDVKRLLKTMALFKLNHFHWHLTDDQGWRFPVEKYPKLISLGSHRKATQIGHDPSGSVDGTPYEGSYTEEEINEIISLAAELHIEVVPEFDLPGHSEALIAAYPEMGNSDSLSSWTPEVEPHFGAFKYTLSPKEEVENFTNDILSEMAKLFGKTSYIHIGGDEVNREQWQNSQMAEKVAEEEHVSVDGLEGKMLEHAAGHLQRLNRHAVVWDEAMTSGANLPEGTVVMLWRSWEGLEVLGSRAQAKNFSVVLAPQANTYLDQWQAPEGSGEKYDAIGGYLSLQKVYDMPLSAGGARVLGVQGQLWSEYIAGGGPDLDYMAWPRGCALAEAGWSGSNKPSYDKFKQRLQHRLTDLQRLEVNYRKLD